jgi:hypothetical protein
MTGNYVKMIVFWIVLILGLADAICVLALTETWYYGQNSLTSAL